MVDNLGKERDGGAKTMAHIAFHDVMSGAVYDGIGSIAYFPSIRIRLTSKFGVMKIFFILSGP